MGKGMSPLGELQWAEVDRRLMAGENSANIARDYDVNKTTIWRRFQKISKPIKEAAEQLLHAEKTLLSLPAPQQEMAMQSVAIAERLNRISNHMTTAADYHAKNSAHLAGLARHRLDLLNSAESDETRSTLLKEAALLTQMSNQAAVVPMELINANKERVMEDQTNLSREIEMARKRVNVA